MLNGLTGADPIWMDPAAQKMFQLNSAKVKTLGGQLT